MQVPAVGQLFRLERHHELAEVVLLKLTTGDPFVQEVQQIVEVCRRQDELCSIT